MFYYVVKTIGDGSRLNPFRPTLPDGVNFVGIEYKGFYLAGITQDLPDTVDRKKQVTTQQIETAAISRGYTLADVMTWFVGDGA